ncbi:MAG: hypothetical protein IJ067_02355 [Prevotella sp.]|nr:hypothetical protein [Prevotella sp.]
MKQFFILLLFLCSTSVFAQDVIVKKDGSTIVCRVVELTSSEIVYKKWSDLNGSNYVMNRIDASAINYQNGKKLNLSEATNLYQPHNQNDGVQQYNDRALLRLDAAAHNYSSTKSKTLKTIGWIGGPALAAFGVVLIAAGDYDFFGFSSSDETLLGVGFIGLGAVWTTSFLIAANHEKKKAEMLQSSILYHYDFKLAGESSLSAGIDMLHDRSIGNNTLGIGLRYNF